jgi:hypothetical protein
MNRVHALLTEEVTTPDKLYRQTQEANVRSRCQIILPSNEGLSPRQIAQQVRFHRRTMTRHIQRYEEEGIDGLLTRPRFGWPPKATEAYTSLLQQMVAQEPPARDSQSLLRRARCSLGGGGRLPSRVRRMPGTDAPPHLKMDKIYFDLISHRVAAVRCCRAGATARGRLATARRCRRGRLW